MSPFVFILISVVFAIGGQLVLKAGMNRIGSSMLGAGFVRQLILSPMVIIGLLVYGIGVIFWLLALSNFELSYVYPFASLSYIGIIIGSVLLFKERINALRVIGIALIIAGVLITSQS